MADDDRIGEGRDKVTLVLNGKDVLIAQSYEVTASFLTQPAAFSMRLGDGSTVRDIIAMCPPRTPFALKIGGVVWQSGYVDGVECQQSDGASTITVSGRDTLQLIHDAMVPQELSIQNATYSGMVERVLKELKLTNPLVYTNEANRKAITGGNPKQTKAPRPPDGGGAVKQTCQSKVGETFYQFLRRHLDRAGLFLWAGANGEFILSEPNVNQKPLYRIVRQRGADPNAVTATGAHFRNSALGRHSECLIYARGGGKKFGRQKSTGKFTDDEMIAWGYDRPRVTKDANCETAAQAEFMARRHLAEERRAGWSLSYTVPGHTAPQIGGGFAVWAPDTVANVVDDEYGIRGDFWVETVTFSQDSKTETHLSLMRHDDLIFGSDE